MAILAPTNADVDFINRQVVSLIEVTDSQNERHFMSTDEIADDEHNNKAFYTKEYLNSLNPPGLLPHDRHVKKKPTSYF